MNFLININLMMLLLIMNSNNWMLIWLINEFLLIFMCSLMMLFNKSLIKFFMYQSLTSMILLIMIMFFINKFLINMNYFLLIIWIKLNMIPFHQWFMSLMKSMNWNLFFLINFPLKIQMMMLLKNLNLKLSIMMLNMLLFLLSMMNLNSMKSILFMNSLINMLWFLMLNLNNNKFMMMFFFFYMMINYKNIKLLKLNSLNYLNQSSMMNNKMTKEFMINLWNLTSIPPSTLFLFKWITLNKILHNFLELMLILMLNIFIQINYFKIMLNNLLNKNNLINWKFKNKFIYKNMNLILMFMFFIMNLI